MSQFEVDKLFASYLAISITFFMGFVSTTSAMLVAVYFAKDSTPPKLAAVIISIYLISSIFLIGGYQRTCKVMIALRVPMKAIVPWHTAVC